jgi:hypothetical protein
VFSPKTQILITVYYSNKRLCSQKLSSGRKRALLKRVLLLIIGMIIIILHHREIITDTAIFCPILKLLYYFGTLPGLISFLFCQHKWSTSIWGIHFVKTCYYVFYSGVLNCNFSPPRSPWPLYIYTTSSKGIKDSCAPNSC